MTFSLIRLFGLFLVVVILYAVLRYPATVDLLSHLLS